MLELPDNWDCEICKYQNLGGPDHCGKCGTVYGAWICPVCNHQVKEEVEGIPPDELEGCPSCGQMSDV